MELQQEELRAAKAKSEQLEHEYADLYDLHTRLIMYYLKKPKLISHGER